MEKRSSRRISISLKAESISGNKNHGIFIENISENGIHILTSPSPEHKKYTAGKNIHLRFRLSSGKTIMLRCRIRWSCLKVPMNGFTDSIGLEIIDPPAQYIEFVRALH